MNRLSGDDQWNKEMVIHMRGSPWEPVPGKPNMHILADVDEEREGFEGEHARDVRPTEALDDVVPVEVLGSLDKNHISRKAIIRYGVTVGCPGCNVLIRRGAQSGKINYHHSNNCRKRIIGHLKGDPEYRRLLEKHGLSVGMVQREVLNEAQMEEKQNQVQSAINEVERKERQTQRGAKGSQLNNMMRKIMFEQMEVVEVYSPLRIVELVRRMGLRAGWSLHLTTDDDYGRPWDFNCKQMRNVAVRKVLQDKPILLIGSPMCAPPPPPPPPPPSPSLPSAL